MANKEKYEYTKTTRFNKSQIDFINELESNGLNLRDVLEYYRINNTDERKRLLNREKYLINHISELKNDLDKSEKELIEVREQLGKAPTENQLRMDTTEAMELITERCKSRYGDKFDKWCIEEYLQTKQSNQVLAIITNKYGIIDIDKFKSELINNIDLYYENVAR